MAASIEQAAGEAGSDALAALLRVALNDDGSPKAAVLPAVKYRLVSDGTTVTAYDKAGATVASGPDGGAVLTACLPAAASAGAMIEFRNDGNVFPWGSVPALPKGITKRLNIVGNGATIQLSAAGPRVFDFNKTADYDTFQNIEIDGFVIDVNNVGGQHHILIGTYVNGSFVLRLNLDQITVRNVRFVNVPTDATLANHRLGIWLGTVQVAAAEGTQTTVTNIRIEKVRQEGGNACIAVFGSFTNALAAGCNTFVDNVTITDVYWDSLIIPVAQFASSCIQVGGRGTLGSCRIRNVFTRGSGDVSIEVDCPREAVVEDVVSEDSFNSALYAINFTSPADANENRWTFRNVVNRKVNSASATNRLLNATVNTTVNIPLGDIVCDTLACYQKTAEAATTTGWAVTVSDSATGGIASLTLKDCIFVSDAINTGATVTNNPVNIASRVTTCRTVMRNVKIKVAGTVTGGQTVTFRGVQLGNGVFVIDWDGVYVDAAITNNTSGAMFAASIGLSGGATTAQGVINRFIVQQMAGDATAAGIIFRGTGFLTIPAKENIRVTNGDFSATTAAREIVLQNDTARQTAVFTRQNQWFTVPAPVAFTGLVSATGLALSAAVVTWPAVVTFVQGSGTAITALDYSTNGGTTYKNILTQASGALPAGYSPSIGPLPPDALIKATFTGTQPTISLSPATP